MNEEFPSGSPLVLTANARLARVLRREFDMQQIAMGNAVWEPADILPLGAWLERCWREWLYSAKTSNPVQLLRPSQELVIWEDIVRSSEEETALLQVSATAEAALEAWNLLHAWRLKLDAPEWTDTRDSEAFRKWAVQFGMRCESRQWLSNAMLPDFIAEKIVAGEIAIPARIELCGFTEWTPLQERLLDAVRSGDCQVELRGGRAGSEQGAAIRLAFTDAEDEIRTSAQWARKWIESGSESGNGEPRIGIVVPEISRLRSEIERTFAEELHPNGRLTPGLDSRRAFNISLGPALSEYPLIQSALLILRSNPASLPLEDASRILRSPFLAGAEAEHAQRGLLDVRLRQYREPEVDTTTIRRLAASESKPYVSPVLAECVRGWERSCAGSATRQMPSDWAATFSSRLRAIGWPGDRPLNSAEYQTTSAWNELLSELAGLDSAAGALSFGSALTIFQRLASSRQFQPESEPAPIQILGVFEASGMEFDHLWIMGMHDGEWPPAANANPFLPLRLQRAHDLPHSSPQRELEFTRLLTRQLLASSPQVVLSYPKREGDSDLRISPLFAEIPESSTEALTLTAGASHSELLRLSSRMETVADHDGPAWDGVLYHGGTAIFEHQAACPFRAFARVRLGAEPLETARAGLTALDRGVLIHDIFQRIWNELGSHETLMAAEPNYLNAVVQDEVQAGLAEMLAKKKALRHPRFAAIEQSRLERLVVEWLELERQRQPFIVIAQEQERQVTVGGIELKIRADRIDQLDDGTHLVLDYKTSAHGPAEWEGSRPDEPQLPLYAVTADVPLSGVLFGIAKLGETGFRGVTSSEGIVPKPKARSKDAPLSEQLQTWRTVLEDLAADFRSGNAIVYPKDPRKTCRYCGLQAVCRIREANVFDDESELEFVND